MTARQEYLKLAKKLSLVSPSNAIYWFDGQLQKAQERIAELEKDKARLDWIEENCTYNGGGNGGVYSFRSPMDTEFFRQAIDAAMKGTNEH